MAEHVPTEPADLGASTDFQAHARTFAGFVDLVKIVVLACVIILMALSIYGFGSGGFVLGTVLTLLMLVGVTFGLVGGTSIPLVVVAGIGLLFMALSLG